MKSISYKSLLASLVACSALSLPMLASAKEIPLLQEPKAGAATAGTADLSYGVIPIFTSKDGDWIKIGDPRNGNVGWVKASELSGNDSTSVVFSHRISNDGKSNSNYQVFQFGTPSKLTPDQQRAIQKLEEQQTAARQALQKAWHDMMENWSMPSPILMPIIVVPQQSSTKAPTAPPAKVPASTKAE